MWCNQEMISSQIALIEMRAACGLWGLTAVIILHLFLVG